MKKRFTDEQIISVLKEQEAGERMYIFGCGVGFREASVKEVIINFFQPFGECLLSRVFSHVYG